MLTRTTRVAQTARIHALVPLWREAHELPPPGGYKGALNGRPLKHSANHSAQLPIPAITPLPSQQPSIHTADIQTAARTC
jgi:hypothetical protein